MPFTAIETLLHESMGLHSSTVGSNTVNQAVTARMRACKIQNASDYLVLLKQSPTELDALIDAVVIPETWFFRDQNPFIAFGHWINQNNAQFTREAPLEILSLPCSTGEEPYTLAMCLADCNIPSDRAHVDAVDISQTNIDKARHGEYGSNSFRGTDLLYRSRHFSAAGSLFRLNGNIKERVQFERGNLLDSDFMKKRKQYRVIFCRNLLIYFDRATQDLALDRLIDLLLPSGLLFVGHSETCLLSNRAFSALEHPRCFGFRKEPPCASEYNRAALNNRPRTINRASVSSTGGRSIRPFLLSTREQQASIDDADNSQDSSIQQAFRLANAGHLHEAATICETLIQRHACQADAHYLLGVVREAAGNIIEAQQFFRKAVYLEPEHIEALTHLSIIARRTGDEQSAQRFRDRASRAQAAGNARQVKE